MVIANNVLRSRRVASATLAIAFAAGVAGCGGSSSGNASSAGSATTSDTAQSSSAGQSSASSTSKDTGAGTVKDPSSPVTISFESWVGSDPTMKKFAADFHKLHPNITIKFENVSADNASDKLTTQIAGGNPPDVAYIDASGTSDFASRDALVNLDPYIKQSKVVKIGDYVNAFRTFVTYNGSTWGMPVDGESTGLFYRKDLFKAAGIAAPPKTWGQFLSDAKKLTIPSKKQYGYELFAPEAAYYWYPWLYQAGGDLLSADGKKVLFTSAAAKKSAAFYVGLAKYSPPDYLNSNSYDGRVAFAQGQTAMYMAGSWFAGTMHSEYPKIDHKWGAAPLPSGPAGCKTTIAGDSLVVLKDTKNADAAWLWVEYLSKPANLATWTYKSPNGTELPPLTSLLNSPDLVKTKPVLKGFASLMKCGVASTVANPKFPQVETSLNDELGKAMYGDQSSDQALQNAADKAQQILGH